MQARENEESDLTRVDLALTSNRDYVPGRGYLVRALWLVVEALVLLNPLVTSYRLKRSTLRLFGARVGNAVLIKPGVHIKYPWRLTIGENCWLGERCWIDNMEDVVLGNNVVVSQGAYLCTGNHDWSDPGMGLTPLPITMEDGVWVGAFSRIAPGRVVRHGTVVALGSVLLEDTEPNGIYAGNPARRVGQRQIREYPGPPREVATLIEAAG
jgi:putative colanic acid biosynthesis acetyltransferase WcaF